MLEAVKSLLIAPLIITATNNFIHIELIRTKMVVFFLPSSEP